MSSPPAYSAPHAPMLLEVVRERIRAKLKLRQDEMGRFEPVAEIGSP